MLSADEMNRYTQQLKLDQIGIDGQEKLKNAKVLCIGAGGLGSAFLFYLAAAGVGTIGVIDDDEVELSNLQRQILYQHAHIGKKKSLIAQRQLLALNPDITVHANTEKLTSENALRLISQYDIIADCSDNFATRYLVSEVCFELNKPYVFASISQFIGQCSLFSTNQHPCFRCLFPNPPSFDALPDCKEGGVLGVLPGLLGIMQATEVLKWILQCGETLAGQLLQINILNMQFRKYQLTKNPECSLCVLRQSFALISLQHLVGISVQELQEKMHARENMLLLDVRSAQEYAIDNLGGTLIPLPELMARLSELNSNMPIIVYCQSGKRSQQAASLLMNSGFNSVQYLRGGLFEWRHISLN